MVNTVLSTAILGLNAATDRVNKAADNIANISTPDHAATDGASLPQDVVDLKLGEIAYKANLAVIETADDMSQELFKIFDEKV